MGKWIKYINVGFSVLIAILVLSCSAGSNRAEYSKYADSVASDISYKELFLEGDSLPVENLEAFEQRAIQKLQDLGDYLAILSDSTLDATFRDQANLMAIELFDSSAPAVRLPQSIYSGKELLSSGKFLNMVKEGTLEKYTFGIGQISVNEKLAINKGSIYTGSLSFIFTVNLQNGVLKNVHETIPMQARILVKKVSKEFGSETKTVWEVFIGEIFYIK